MSETASESTPEFDRTLNGAPSPSSDVVSITEAAQRLGVSVRTVQRRLDAGQLLAVHEGDTRRVKLPDGTRQGDTLDTSPHATRDATQQRLGAPPTRQRPTKADFSLHHGATDRATGRHDDAPQGDTRHDKTHDGAALLAEKDGRISDLREQLAAARLQIEAHARAEAELRAALREALRLHQKALPSGSMSTHVGAPLEDAQDTQNTLGAVMPGAAAKGAEKGTERAAAKREPRPLWKVVLGIR